MPVKIQSDLPARKILERENIFVMTSDRASSQDIRPLKLAIVNLMPTKIDTETQLLRLLSNTPLQVEVSLFRMEHHVSHYTGEEHLERFYVGSDELFKRSFDGMVITGAPVEQMPFEEVDYWDDLCKIMDYARSRVFCTLYICWGAQAGLYHLYGVKKHLLKKKLFGVFMNRRTTSSDPLLRGFDDLFPIPQSRHTTIEYGELSKISGIHILAQSTESGVSIIKSCDNRSVFITGHLEYDTDTLAAEYWRDKGKGLDIDVPAHYFPGDNPEEPPVSVWRSTAHLFYSNWLNYYVYQETPYVFA